MNVASPVPQVADGIVTLPSPHSFAETLARIEAEIASRGLTVFARFDHAAAARAAGLEMPDTCVLAFGNPKAGTPVMVASPLVAFELPLRVLVRSDRAGQVFVSFGDPGHLARRYGVADPLARNIAAVPGIVEAALKAA